ncbi:scavenger receptor cysteine-rich domain superfamily protein-like [Gigantopelta aegis]|uniref:scavenger receptor cysteine-rich domain superfamily protein-like n=1 Tax=Gigantopelta aegis TaxID=1735272 RepID=UPI001B88B76A|nr:scavenger receptor cysteine-rich domain superfamily protein-like [Gigantopelta aegis]
MRRVLTNVEKGNEAGRIQVEHSEREVAKHFNVNVQGAVVVQLVNGPHPNEGRVEIIRDGERGTVCDDRWDDADAAVICRMLGYGTLDNFQYVTGEGNIRVELVNGAQLNEGRVEVIRSGVHGTVCDENWDGNDATVICRMVGYKRKRLIIPASKTPGDITVELVDGPQRNEGRVEIVRNGVSGTICDDHWDEKDASVICRMLGYNNGGIAHVGATYGQGTGTILLDDVQCNGGETTMDNCTKSDWGTHNCSHANDAGVTCNNPSPRAVVVQLVNGSHRTEGRVEIIRDGERGTVCDDSWDDADAAVICRMLGYESRDTPGDITVELVDGPQRNEGRVEIVRNGVRGTICDDHWDEQDASVICRMLGYNNGGITHSGAKYGQGTGTILLDDVQCHGGETTIDDCTKTDWATHNCSHANDAGLTCNVLSSKLLCFKLA